MIFFLLYCQRTINIIIILLLIVFSKCFSYFFFCRGGWIWTNVNQLTFQHVISVRVYAPFIRFVIHSHRHLKAYLTFYGVFDSHQIKHTLLTFLAMDIRLCSAYFYWVLVFNSARLLRIKSHSLLTKAITIERRSWKLRCYQCLANHMFVEAMGLEPINLLDANQAH